MSIFVGHQSWGQDLPEDELQVNLSSYFDNFDVQVIYPSVSLTKKVSETTSLNGRYLIDVVSAASIRGEEEEEDDDYDDDDDDRSSSFGEVDAVSSASSRAGLGLISADDVRHEVVGGVTQLIAGRILSVNGIYSRENDYSSATLAATLTHYFARKNATVQLGVVRSWDRVFPVEEDWTRTKDVTTYSINISQILGKRLIGQALFSLSDNSGYLADPYKKVGIGAVEFDPSSPDSRMRKAASTRFIYRINERSTIQAGYRYYWDTWEIDSHTISGLYQRHVTPGLDVGLGFRSYLQSDAYFYERQYVQPVEFMTVDNKLDTGFSNELQFKLTLKGGQGLSFLRDDRMQVNLALNVYQRHTESPDWFTNKTELVAAYFNVGLRYKL